MVASSAILLSLQLCLQAVQQVSVDAGIHFLAEDLLCALHSQSGHLLTQGFTGCNGLLLGFGAGSGNNLVAFFCRAGLGFFNDGLGAAIGVRKPRCCLVACLNQFLLDALVSSAQLSLGFISSGEAIKMLASRAGMPEPQEDDKTGHLRSRVLSMNKEAARFFHACLNSTVEEARQARAYWRRRNLDDKTIVRFGLGYAPNDGQALYQYLRDKGYNQQELDASGLFKRSQSGRIYCLFWKRVMTPIFDLRGNIIAFGGRVMDDSKPKYVNSPETLVYHKSETVFAMQIAKRSASRRFVLCEGYMDVISMQQAGIDTAVCACGTALTPGQVRIISEYADNRFYK